MRRGAAARDASTLSCAARHQDAAAAAATGVGGVDGVGGHVVGGVGGARREGKASEQHGDVGASEGDDEPDDMTVLPRGGVGGGDDEDALALLEKGEAARADGPWW